LLFQIDFFFFFLAEIWTQVPTRPFKKKSGGRAGCGGGMDCFDVGVKEGEQAAVRKFGVHGFLRLVAATSLSV
jgi:hypothetical protein